jgi:hypothetical protein
VAAVRAVNIKIPIKLFDLPFMENKIRSPHYFDWISKDNLSLVRCFQA